LLLLALTAARAWLALRHASVFSPEPYENYTIVQPILSGDPLLEATLGANLAAHPDTPFLWLIDDDDDEAHRIARQLARPNLRVLTLPPPRDGQNPKLAKLEQALPLVSTQRLLVLDDDTVLPANPSFPAATLATGLPIFHSRHTLWERLTGGFVNSNAALTYLPAARLGIQRTLNGMIYAADCATLRSLGGFAAAGHELTDDYAVARLFLRHGLAITQCPQPAFVSMTIASPAHYARVMRRWMIFATHYFRGNLGLKSFMWIALPSLLPALGLLTGAPLAWILVLLAKAALNRWTLHRITGFSSTALDLIFEIAADLLTPFWMLAAFIRPSRLTWRRRRIRVENGQIRYQP
jgi:ceramide glucosyltransferase